MPRKWKGGPLRLFEWSKDGSYRAVHPRRKPEMYAPVTEGWAIAADDLCMPLGEDLDGIELEFEVRDGRLQCVEIRSCRGGPELSSGLLRRLEPIIGNELKRLFEYDLRQVIRLDSGEFAALVPGLQPRLDIAAMSDEDFEQYLTGGALVVYDEQRRRPGRRPLADEHLRQVAVLYQEAAALNQPRTAYIARTFRDYEPTTIRNWIRQARKRGFLPPPNEQQPKGEGDG